MIVRYDENGKKVRLPTVTDDKILGFFGDYRFLSNFHVCKIDLDGYSFISSEGAYMAMKSHDVDYKRLLQSVSPSAAKQLGKTVDLREDWDYYRVLAMHRALIAKFLQNSNLLKKLAATGDRYLEETNDWGDTFWGVCDGEGLNMLGKTLMSVRKDFSFLARE